MHGIHSPGSFRRVCLSPFKSPAADSAALHWAPLALSGFGVAGQLVPEMEMCTSHSHTSFKHTHLISSLISSTLNSIDRRSLTVIGIFAFSPNSFEFPCIITLCIIALIILSRHKLEAGGQAEVFGKIAKGKSSVSGNICLVHIFYLPTALRWKKVSKCEQAGNESNTKSARESWFIPNVNSEIIKKPGCNQSKWWFTLYILVLRRKRGIMSQCELNACPCFPFPLLNIFIF